jgi:hypothetical protein
MKYLITILVIICTATLLTLYFVWPEKSMDKTNIAVTINGHNLARTTVTAEGEKAGYHSEDYPELLDSAITRELLIQEAQRQELDKEESFRVSLKTFYEESLIKTLMDRQYGILKVEVNDGEISDYLALFGKMVTFTRLPVSTSAPKIPTSDQGPQNEVLFDDLADPLKFLLSHLKPGEYAMKFDTGSEQYAIRLDMVAPAVNMPTAKPDRDQVRKILEDYKRQQQIANWLNELRSKASITIHNG